MGGSQQLTVLEAKVSLTGNEWQKHPIVTGPEAPCILGIGYLSRGYFKDPKAYQWAFGIAALETEGIKQLSTLPGLSEDPSVVGLLRIKEQQVPIATTTVHQRQYRTNRDSLIPIHKLIRQLESQGVIGKTHSPFNSPIWPVQNSTGEWRLTVDYRDLNEVTPPLSAAMPDMLELQYELESKAATCKVQATVCFHLEGRSVPLEPIAPGWKHRPTICHGLIQTALEKGEAPEHLQHIDDIIVKRQGMTRGRPLGFWSRGYRGSEARYTPTGKEILASYEGVRDTLEVVGTEAQLLLAPRLPVLGWMVKGRVHSTHRATDATWSKWVAPITQQAQTGNPNRPGILELIMDWPEGKDFGISPEEVTQPAKGDGESSQFAEVKDIQLALDIAEREKWPVLYLYTDSWIVANVLWGWLQQWKQNNWQRRGKPIWAAALWQNISARVEKLVVKVRHVDAHVPKSRATEEHQNNQKMDHAAQTEVAQVDLDWQHRGELFIAWWAHDTSGHQGRDATYRWAHDRGVDLTMDAIAQVIHECETCAAIKQAKRLNPLWCEGRWLKYKYGEAWQIDCITLPQTRQGKLHVLTMVEATTGWLETYPVPHAAAWNIILGLEKQVLWRHATPERTESDNGTHFQNNLRDTGAKEHGIEWVHKKLGGGTAKIVDPNWPKGYSIPYGIMLSIETGGEVGQRFAVTI
ncbi:hypothetical protein QYF61_018598 [Mycteria americana]|uniref:Uncharacterized protein n=1 Tax=Mycteria americana TaxID=33587 RepID=A0AAN7S895_MYCAM|nr:hypothetical protein QYF61_018598 [Mycteria americana]